ncbi:hypothetical protein TNCV_2681341 [Trichonephila clavipes]|uniref:Uncharacterized protein n=1 Tax=Trichonephila clavipes TaxID=2585209 RepID=A0A8X6S602_TRICX|nr:hypothetical protein TNCV_2681341 [Trichonephila clavipes]
MVDISLSADENSYRAAVFEIVQFQIEDSSYSGEDIINKNLEKYDKAAKIAAENRGGIETLPDLKASIIGHVGEISRELLRATIENTIMGLRHVIDVNGAHIEHIR